MNGDTKLSEALKASPDILDYIVSLNPHDFNRLHNPLLAKVMPPRITLRRIAAMVNMPVADLVARVNEIAGLENDGNVEDHPLPTAPASEPKWLIEGDREKIVWVDVTPLDLEGGDPMPPINIAINGARGGDIIGIKHMWEPQPFYDIWHARGFEFWSEKQGPDLWHVFVYRPPTQT